MKQIKPGNLILCSGTFFDNVWWFDEVVQNENMAFLVLEYLGTINDDPQKVWIDFVTDKGILYVFIELLDECIVI